MMYFLQKLLFQVKVPEEYSLSCTAELNEVEPYAVRTFCEKHLEPKAVNILRIGTKWSVTLLVFLCGLGFSLATHAQRGLSVAVIAHSVSTRIEARAVLSQQGWTETTNLRQADAILVVCRSGLNWPLNSSYDSIKELDDDADSQLNIAGSNYHVYLYRINDDLSVDEMKHIHYPADD